MRPLSCHGTRVAHPRPEGIPEGDGVPLTHTPIVASRHRKVTTGPAKLTPPPFAAFRIPAIPAAIAMAVVVLTAAVHAVLTVYAGDPTRWALVGGLLAALASWCALLAVLGSLLRRKPVAGQVSRYARTEVGR